MAKLGGIPLALACALQVRYPPYKRSISVILGRYHMSTRQNVCDAPSAMVSRKGISLGDKVRFCKRVVWRMYPRSGFRSGGTCERTLVPVFVPGEHLPKPRTLFGKPPFCQLQRIGIVQKVFSEKVSAITRLCQKCVKNAPTCVLFYRGKN